MTVIDIDNDSLCMASCGFSATVSSPSCRLYKTVGLGTFSVSQIHAFYFSRTVCWNVREIFNDDALFEIKLWQLITTIRETVVQTVVDVCDSDSQML